MNEQLSVWLDNLLPWLLTHGINILIVISGTFILNKVFKRIIRRSVRIAVSSNSQVSQDAEKKREETLMRIFNGIVKILLVTIATLMILSYYRSVYNN